ncbi:peptidase S8 [Pectobacterium versatile]|uniref:autotransporter domain-containing protein n=1 Tax=Pectobacterium versatile TaxID=2488639 RepID=UPI000B7BAB04|nr:autotransporter serine protease [Pectobacterium versatile]ASN86501.1 Autotransporter serine protease [Pectobacterium versatile]MBQ4762648.1 autotransporter domain-containing protein [Pectobacterium versatile]POY60673.1 peptidase S8 [Pectobacterium versatile]POY63859.1 peptidase S8 [Pectobacterium versatile]TAI86405.1 autotransporter domain-containing protein [Pectobacterium versatile]
MTAARRFSLKRTVSLKNHVFRQSIIAANISLALLMLAGCGSGGGGGSETASVAPTSPPTTTPTTPTAPTTPTTPGTPGTPTASAVKVGIIDSGLEAARPEFNYSNLHFTSFVGGSQLNDNQGVNGHGTLVALALAGLATESYAGGVAPDSELYIAQTSLNNRFDYQNTTSAVNWLLNSGVKIINMSYGQDERLTTTETFNSARNNFSYLLVRNELKSIVDAEALSIVATGNNAGSTPSPNTQIPLIFGDASLQKGILAVTGYIPEWVGQEGNERPAEMYLFDKCGNVAVYCMSAPGYVDYPVAGSSASERSHGTSFAAPRVAGGASRVQAAYPWMTGYNLQQTLLTTATYHTDGYTRYDAENSYYEIIRDSDGNVTGSVFHPAYISVADTANGRPYNDTFGWGDLNVEKAVKGPAMFYADNFTARLTAGDYTFANDISGDYGLIVNGANNAGGVLHLTGNNTYKGDTQITANSLYVDGSIAGNASVSGSGTLAGKGRIGGNVSNTGLVATTADGGLTVAGNYTQGSNGLLSVTLANPFTVEGSAALDGTLRVGLPSNTYIVQTQETLLHSNQGISGTFRTTDLGLFLTGNLTYGSNDVTGAFSRLNTVEAATSSGLHSAAQLQTAANIESALQVADRWSTLSSTNEQQSSLLAKAAAFQQLGSASAAATALDSLSGQAHTSSNAILFNSLDYQNQLLNNRLDLLGSGKNYGLWIETGKLRGDLNQSGYLGSHYDITLTAIGTDTDFNTPGLRAGIAYTNSQIKADYDGSGGSSENELHGVMTYARYNLTPEWYVQGNLSYQHGRDKLKRSILLNNVEAVSSSTSSDSWQSLLKTGYELALNDIFSVQPYAGLKYSYLSTGGFTDTGSALGLTGEGNDYSRTVGLTGLNLRALLQWNQGWWSSVGVSGEYQHAFTNPSLDVSARWSGLGREGERLDIPGIRLDKDSQWAGVRLDVGKAVDARFFLRADKHFADRGNEEVLRGGVDVSF